MFVTRDKSANFGACRSAKWEKPLGDATELLWYPIKVLVSLNLHAKFGESVNILKSSKQCRQNENRWTPFKILPVGEKYSSKLIPGYINETYESRKFHRDQRRFLVTWPSVRGTMESPGHTHTQSCWTIQFFTGGDVCAEFGEFRGMFMLLNVLLFRDEQLNLQKQ